MWDAGISRFPTKQIQSHGRKKGEERPLTNIKERETVNQSHRRASLRRLAALVPAMLGGSAAPFNTQHLIFFFPFILSLNLNPQRTLYFSDLYVQISWFGLVFGARFLLCLFHRN